MSVSVDVWVVSLDAATPAADELSQTLSADEISRARRFRFPRHADRWLLSRLALRRVLADYVGREPADLAFEHGPHGKPSLAGPAGAPRFNLSHSGRQALIAVSRELPVGVDVEAVRRFGEMDGVARRVFTPGERSLLPDVGDEAYPHAFHGAWTRKEAAIKLTGEGMAADLQGIELLPAANGRIEVRRFGAHDPAAIRLYDLDTGRDYRAALAVASAGPVSVRLRAFDAA